MNEILGSEMNLQTKAKILDLKRVLNKVKDISYSSSLLTKDYPLEKLKQRQAEQLIIIFEGYIRELLLELKNYE